MLKFWADDGRTRSRSARAERDDFGRFLQEEKLIQEGEANEGNGNIEDVSGGEGDGDDVEEI